jgi:hypothetical protein
MPSIESLLKEVSGYHPVEDFKPAISSLSSESPIDVYTRCPVPQVGNVASYDSISQADRKGAIPQYRIFVGI